MKAVIGTFFKIPSLRKVQMTSPYMHDGSIAALSDVVEQYNAGGINHGFTDSRIEPLDLSVAEKGQLIAFLESL